jgi:Rps23 Pro-64 3,4-dihydroxylase Tpa1-like proline 4-hydroxylase
MVAAFSANSSYVLNSRIISSISSSDSVAVFGLGAPFELPLACFQVLMAFAEPKTGAHAFETLDVDVDAGEFDRILGDFVERGLLTLHRPEDDGCGLQQLLASGTFGDAAVMERVAGCMRDGRAVVVPDALPADLAEEVYRDLSLSSEWTLKEGGHDFYHFRNSTISYLEDRSSALAECSRLFKSKQTRRFISELSGQDCSGTASAAAAWYRPGEYALPHDDSAADKARSVAYIWYLAKDWRREWGGSLFWCSTGQYISPQFNMLVMFNVTPSSVHWICPVSPAATAKRLTINGFWHRSERAAPSPPIPPEAFVSPRRYGPAAPDLGEQVPIVVL